MRFPKLAIVYVFDALPSACLAAALMPTRTQMAVIQAEHPWRPPRRHMHAVGRVADRHFVFRASGIEHGPHRARNLTMQGRYSVGPACEPQTQYGHAESLMVVMRMLAAQAHQPLFGES